MPAIARGPAGRGQGHTGLGIALGTEYYASLGRFDLGFSASSEQEDLLFGALDLEPGEQEDQEPEWELNAGVSLRHATPQHAISKMILRRSF